MKAVILAGGEGTRLAPYTTVFPKPMLPLGKKPILEILIRQLSYYGFKDIILSVGYLSEIIHAYFYNNRMLKDVNLEYVKEHEPLGTAGSLSLIKGLNETFLVINGDILTTLDYRKLIKFHKRNRSMLTIAAHKRDVKIDYGVMYGDAKGRLRKYDEKPTLNYLVSMGIYIFEPEVLAYIALNKKLDFPDLVKKLLVKGEKVLIYPNTDYWLDIGRHDDYKEAVEIFEKKQRMFLKL